MSSINDQNEPTNPWNHEQAPFVGAETEAATAAAAADAGAPPNPAGAGQAGEPYSYSASGTTGAAGTAQPGTAQPGTAQTGTAQSGGWSTPSGAYAVPPPVGPPLGTMPASSGEPSPGLAFFLGLIPGVGAMYNGQVAKGIVHLIVFAVLVTIANDVNDVFGIFVAGWIFFQAFEAYHTAKARRDGLPLPNAFGWNDIGERVGLGKNWPFSPGAAVNAPPPAATAGTVPAGWSAVPPVSPFPPMPPVGASPYANVAPNWAGYVPPTAFASAPPAPTAGYTATGTVGVPLGTASGQAIPYTDVSAGAPYTPYVPGAVVPSPSRLPVGAMWLIGLGVLFLLGQWTPMLQLGRVWIPSIVLAGLAALLFARRMGWTGAAAWQATNLPMEARVASAIRIPGILLTIAILNALHEAWIVRWYRSWPCLLIVIGLLMLVERMALRQASAALDPLNGATPDNTRTGDL